MNRVPGFRWLESARTRDSARVLALMVLSVMTGLPAPCQGADPKAASATVLDVSALTGALSSSDSRQRIEAAERLAEAGPAARAALPALARMAQEKKDAYVRIAACKALAAVGPDAPEVVEVLLAVFKDTTYGGLRTRREIRQSVAQCAAEKILPGLRELLHGEDEEAAMDAMAVLVAMKDRAAKALPDIIAATKASLGYTRRLAVQALASCGAGDSAAQKTLVAMLEDEKPLVRLEVVHRLGQAGLPSGQIVSLYVRALGDADERVRMAAAYAISQLPAGTSTPVVAAVKAADPLTRAAAIRAIGLSSTPPQGGPEAVAAALKDCEAEVRASAAQALAWLGGDAAAGAYDGLMELSRQSDSWVRSAAVSALRHGGSRAIARLIEALGDEDHKVRREAADALASLGSAAVSELSRLSANRSPQLRWRWLEVVKRMGPAAKEGVPACLKALDDKEWYVRREAVRALAAIAPKDAQVMARFRDRVASDEEWTVRKEAFDALESWGAEGTLTVKPY